MFGVYNNNKPASSVGYPQLKGVGWETHQFVTFDEAREYAIEWLREWAPEASYLKLNQPYNYSGYGDTIEIREE